MGVVAGMHLALLLVLARGYGSGTPLTVPPNIEGAFIETPMIHDPLPPPPTPEFQNLNYDVVPPDGPIAFETSTEAAISTPQAAQPGEGESGSAIPEPNIVNVRQDPRFPLSQPAYHPADIREGNQGFVDVEIYVLPDGRVGDARVVRSSGFERMDRATLEEAKRRWRLVPATRDGQPFAQWHRLRVVFKLKDR